MRSAPFWQCLNGAHALRGTKNVSLTRYLDLVTDQPNHVGVMVGT